jgi:uroporphyrinogen decarboxylase
VPDLDKLRYVFDAVTSIRRGAERPRAPDRLFRQPLDAGLLHGRRRRLLDDWRGVKSMLYSRPDLMHRILAVNAEAVAAYLNAQIDAGAQAVMVFDSWGGALADGAFQQFSLPTPRRCWPAQAQHDGASVPASCSPRAAACGWTRWPPDCDVLGVDWTVNLGGPRQVGGSKALQGNLDPAVLFAPPEQVGPRSSARSTASARRTPRRATCSTWAMASARPTTSSTWAMASAKA